MTVMTLTILWYNMTIKQNMLQVRYARTLKRLGSESAKQP